MKVSAAHSPAFTSRRLYRNDNCTRRKKENFLRSKSHPFFTQRLTCGLAVALESRTQRRIFARDGEKLVGHEQSSFHTCLRVRKVVNEHVVSLFPFAQRYIENTFEELTPVREVTIPLYPREIADYRSIEHQNQHRVLLEQLLKQLFIRLGKDVREMVTQNGI